MVQVKAIKAFSDNYIWCLIDTQSAQAWVVDPGQSEPVFAYLAQAGLMLAGILITHHHYDHTDGVNALCDKFSNIDVYGPANSPFKGITKQLNDGDSITVLNTEFKIITTPGHTLDHICYTHPALAFTGDTLFSGGCGRLFEGTPQQMYQSFEKLKALPLECKIYCTHEYTQANLAFALAVEPNNPDLIHYSNWVNEQRSNALITLPSNLGRELKINPFMRADIPSITALLPAQFTEVTKNSAQKNEPWQNFAGLRAWKDHF